MASYIGVHPLIIYFALLAAIIVSSLVLVRLTNLAEARKNNIVIGAIFSFVFLTFALIFGWLAQ